MSARENRARLAFRIGFQEFAYKDIPRWRAVKRWRLKRYTARFFEEQNHHLAAAVCRLGLPRH